MIEPARQLAATVPTPEGVPLQFTIASVPERALAFGLDLLLVLLLLLLVGLAALALPEPLAIAALTLAGFALRVGYFALGEVRGNGTTIGKRRLRLRVVRADGGPLTTEVLLARNLTREVEFFLPLGVLLTPELLGSGHPALLRILASVWLLLLLLLPLSNRLRLRVGDLLAGTLVVVAPRASLLGDLASERPAGGGSAGSDRGDGGAAAPAVPFTPAQLGIYGIYELQVLEDVLRKAAQPGGDEAVAAVAAKIKARIGWRDGDGGPAAPLAFLQAFYQAQRAWLEHRLLLGKRKERKEPRRR